MKLKREHSFKQQSHPLPYLWYYLPVTFLVALGTGSSVYLAIVHYLNYTDINFSSICAISKAINCDTVAQSPYAIFLGVPVAIWGTFSFLFLGQQTYVTRAQKCMTTWWVIFLFGAAGCAVSVLFGYISVVKIQSYCIFCLLCYFCYFSITFYSLIVIRRFRIPFTEFLANGYNNYFLKANLLLCFLLFSGLALLVWQFPKYWQYQQAPIATAVTTGTTSNGSHWIGAKKPTIIIHEYTDYLCFQCGKMHHLLRNLVNTHPETIRLVHHHFPMDHLFNPAIKKPFHVGAGYMALLAILAGEKVGFWRMNHELCRFIRENKSKNIDLQVLAERTGLPQKALSQALSNPIYRKILIDNIRHGLELGVISTPTYIINNKIFTGTIPRDILSNLKR